jgi:hypothetical protein
MSFQSINSSKPKEELFMRISKLFETVHTDFNVSAHIAKVVDTQIAKYKNIKNLSYGPGSIVESIDLTECTYEESQRRMTELDRRISETIAKFNLEIQTAKSD